MSLPQILTHILSTNYVELGIKIVTLKPVRLQVCLLISENIIEAVVFILGKAVKLLLKAVF